MTRLPRQALLLACTALTLAAACGDDALQDANGDLDGTDAGDTLDASPARDTVTLTGQVVDSAAPAVAGSEPAFPPFAGAEGCVLDSDPPVCATSDDDGHFEIDLPANARTGVTFEVDGMVPMLTPFTTGDDDIDLTRSPWTNRAVGVIAPLTQVAALGTWFGIDVDDTSTHVDFIATELGDGTVTLEDGSAEVSWWLGLEGVPLNADENPAPESDQILLGFSNVEPGMVTFRAEEAGEPCTWDPLVWAGAEPGTVTVPIRAGWWTRLMEVRCE